MAVKHEEALAIERRFREQQMPLALDQDHWTGGFGVRLVDLIDGELKPLGVVIPDVPDEEMPLIIDGEILPVPEAHPLHAEIGHDLSLPRDGKELLTVPAASIVVSPKDPGELATQNHAGAFTDARGVQAADDRNFGGGFRSRRLVKAGLFRGDIVEGTPAKAKRGGQRFDLARVQNDASLLVTLAAKRTVFHQNRMG